MTTTTSDRGGSTSEAERHRRRSRSRSERERSVRALSVSRPVDAFRFRRAMYDGLPSRHRISLEDKSSTLLNREDRYEDIASFYSCETGRREMTYQNFRD